ncbi:PLP-dependent aminotransferase family protein [Naasia lichenicola]|uniref:PLP-dependent aminotransferase family protein n=1 Tax=Naasia lichenicola TaxID=2565933 RepID=A0A4S4FH05_9MICO|nr:PLP-dependent aminotransferase family protein [Naasia lichenicola]THG29559.1 PLP-dependent aminotransferase family protein [Naasia lichenicola]
MSVPGIGTGQLIELLSDWDGASAPSYRALSDRLRLLAIDGRMPAGTRLPAERELSARLGISRTTVAAAYAAMRADGYLESRRGSGSVTRIPGRASAAMQEIEGLIDLSRASMPASPGLMAATSRALEALPRHLGDSGYEPIGLPVLREAIAARYRERGLPTTADQILVTTGAQSAIALVARALLSRGDRAVAESPSYPHAFEALRLAGARVLPVGVTTDDGWDEAGFIGTVQRSSPVLAYLLPDLHNPTGRTMPADQRARIVALAEDYGTTLLIDETMAELRIDGEVGMPLATLAGRPDSVITIGSLSKSVWGGLRIGWIRADPALVRRILSERAVVDLGTPVIEQLIAAEMLGDMPAVLAERSRRLRSSRDALAGLIAERLPDWHVPRVEGGLSFWVGLGKPVSSQLSMAARRHGVAIPAGPRFGLDGAFERFIRVPFTADTDTLERAVDGLVAAWHSLDAAPGRAPEPLLTELV